MSGNNTAAAMLREGIDDIEDLIDRRKEINALISAKRKTLKGQGFDTKVIDQMIKERAMDPSKRAEWHAICSIYRASLGMLGDTPLGEFARNQMEEAYRKSPPSGASEEEAAEEAAVEEAPTVVEEAPKRDLTPEDIEAAREKGREAARSGQGILTNPYTARDPRRAAWDEGWCAEAGSDGMEVPSAWRRAKPKKPKKGEGGEGAEGEGGE